MQDKIGFVLQDVNFKLKIYEIAIFPKIIFPVVVPLLLSPTRGQSSPIRNLQKHQKLGDVTLFLESYMSAVAQPDEAPPFPLSSAGRL
jgi:hypothetical protein